MTCRVGGVGGGGVVRRVFSDVSEHHVDIRARTSQPLQLRPEPLRRTASSSERPHRAAHAVLAHSTRVCHQSTP